MKKIKIVFCSIMALMLSGFFLTACAQTVNNQSDPSFTLSEVPENMRAGLFSTLGIYDIKILSQDGNKFKISFRFQNYQKEQSQVKYTVKLKKDGNFVDYKTYDEVLSIKENVSISKEIEYSAPEFFKGEHELWIFAQNDKGRILSTMTAGKITLNGSGKFVFIDETKSSLIVKGEKESFYNLSQGVDVDKSERIILNFEIKNYSGAEIAIQPYFNTYLRNVSGDLVNSKKPEAGQNVILLKTDEKKLMSLTLPENPEKPQAYDTELYFIGKEGKIASNKIPIHFVVRGNSASIQNLTFDKEYYQKGETAEASLVWFPSADIFPESRLEKQTGQAQRSLKYFAEISLQNDKNDICGSLNKELSQEKISEPALLEVPIKKECSYSKAIVVLKDENGTVLDQNEFTFKNSSGIANEAKKDFNNKIIFVFGILTAILILGVMIFYGIKKRSNKFVSLILVFVVSFSVFCFSFKTSKAAAAWSVGFDWIVTDFWAGLSTYYYNSTDYITAVATGGFSPVCTNRPGYAAVNWRILNSGGTPVTDWMNIVSYEGAAYTITYKTCCRSYEGWPNPIIDNGDCYSGAYSCEYPYVETASNSYTYHLAVGSATGYSYYYAGYLPPGNYYVPQYAFYHRGGSTLMNDGYFYVACPATAACQASTCTGQTCYYGNCGFTGTKKCCTDTSWSPDPTTVCNGDPFSQKSNCGTNRTAIGTMPSVSGQCGSAAHSILNIKPSGSSLCNLGTPSTVNSTNDYWTWTCSGICGGASSGECSTQKDKNMKEVSP